jgi:hypothetical protein
MTRAFKVGISAPSIVKDGGLSTQFLMADGSVSAGSSGPLTQTALSTGFSIAGGTISKTLQINNTIAFSGTDSTTFTFPTTSGTVATLNTNNIFSTAQTITPGTSLTGLTINAATSSIGLILKANATTPGNMQEWQDSSGNILASMDSSALTLQTNLTTGNRGLILRNSNSAISGAIFTAQKSRGTTASPTVVATGDLVAAFSFSGYNGTAYPTDTSLFGAAVTNVSGSVISQSLYFSTGASGSGNYVPSMLVHHNGGVGIGSSFGNVTSSLVAPIAALQVNSIAVGTPVIVSRAAAGQTANLEEWQNNGGTALAKVDSAGNFTAASIVKTGGTSSQYLLADGTVTTSAGIKNTYSATAPTSPTAGDMWVDTSDGTSYTYINDGDSNQWVELATGSSIALQGIQGLQGPTGANGSNGSMTLSINSQIGTTFTPVSSDLDKLIVLNAGASNVTVTINSVFTQGQQVHFVNYGTGTVTFAQGSGVTIVSTGSIQSAPKLRTQYSTASLICTTSGTVFLITGDII